MRTPTVAGVCILLVVAAAGCAADPGAPAGPSPSEGRTRTLTVFAAASLKSTFTILGERFEAGHPGTDVTFNFAGSADLVTQLQQGAPADVFAAADAKNMDRATADDLVTGTPTVFASNTLEIAVPPDNPAGVTSLQDLTEAGIRLVVCAPVVPCGSAAAKIQAEAGISLEPVSEESSVTDVLNKVQTGEADAGLVYVTDVRAAGDQVVGVAFAEASTAVNSYPIATLAASRHPDLAREFTALVSGPEGTQVLTDAGFGRP